MSFTIAYNKYYQKEKKYIINTLFKEFLGLNIKHEIKNTKHYEININNTKVIIEDHFFNKAENQKTYLKQQSLPKVVQEIKNPLNFKGSLISLYGENKIYQNNNLITCGIDIFASAYFMLSRWEDHII
tara:strand:- start:1501 stop:1884 length:384 start_codon:yes stop_codon:yes gene_type:complete